MNKLKRILIYLSLIVLILMTAAYASIRYMGLIPRSDYSHMAPELPQFTKPAVLVFNKTNGFIHHGALAAANKMLSEKIKASGWQVFVTDNGAIHNMDDLKKFSLIIWNNVSGDVLTTDQRLAMRTWIEQGGGWLGLHASGGDKAYDWPWYVDTLIGAQFVGHTMWPHLQDAHMLVSDPTANITQHLPSPWLVKNDEWYAFDQSPRNKGYEILLSADEASYITQGKAFNGFIDRMAGEHSLVWRHSVGKGRAFYSALGHNADTYGEPDYQTLLIKAMAWAIKK